jgi:hypothetical protein
MVNDQIVNEVKPFMQTSWVVTTRDFGENGQEAICRRIDVFDTWRVEGRGIQFSASDQPAKVYDESDRERSARRARKQVRLKAKALGADRLLTLTYRENMQDRGRLLADFKKFVRRMRKSKLKIEYVAVPELQKRGAWHMHLAVRGRQNYNLVRSIWRSVVGADNGNVDVKNPFKMKALRHKLVGYLCKYIGKTFDRVDESNVGLKAYFVSHGIDQPVVETTYHSFANWGEAGVFMLELFDAYKLSEQRCYQAKGLDCFFIEAS